MPSIVKIFDFFEKISKKKLSEIFLELNGGGVDESAIYSRRARKGKACPGGLFEGGLSG